MRGTNKYKNTNNMNTTCIILIQLYSGTVTRVSRFTRADRCTIATCSNQGHQSQFIYTTGLITVLFQERINFFDKDISN
jgi:hypothetical protein